MGHACVLAYVAGAVAALIATAELNRLVEGALTEKGRGGALHDVIGPRAFGSTRTWSFWSELEEDKGPVAAWIGLHTLVDLVFVTLVALTLWRTFSTHAVGGGAHTVFRLLYGWVLVEIVEAVLLFGCAVALAVGGVPGPLIGFVALMATAKWLAVVCLVIAVLRKPHLRRSLRQGLTRTRRAILVQRLSFVVVALVAALGLVPLPNIWDQLPDVQRAWVPGGTDLGNVREVPEAGHPVVWAVVVTVLVTMVPFVLGRQRAERAWTTWVVGRSPEAPARYGWWLVGPVAAASGDVVLHARGRGDDLVDGKTLAVFIAVPITLVACSWVLRWRVRAGAVVSRRATADRPEAVSPSAARGAVRGGRTERRGESLGVAVDRGWMGFLSFGAGLFAVLVAFVELVRAGDPIYLGLVIVIPFVLVFVLALTPRGGTRSLRGELTRRENEGCAPIWDNLSPAQKQKQRAKDVWCAGDLLAVVLIVIVGLGLVRSFTAPVALLLEEVADPERGFWQVVGLVVGVALAVGAPLLGRIFVRWLDKGEAPDLRQRAAKFLRPDYEGVVSRGDPPGVLGRAGLAVVWIVFIFVLGCFVVAPLFMTARLGVVATTLAALGAWAVFVGFFITHLQHRRPLEVFRLLGLRANPVLTIVGAALLVVSVAGGDPDLHAIRTTGPVAGAENRDNLSTDNRDDLSTAFKAWLGCSTSCDRVLTTSNGTALTVRPLVLVAASGGGIRAATWTASAMHELSDAGECGRSAVLLSSGVSGGSVGLVLARGATPLEDAKDLAQPQALAVGLAGTLVGDIVAALSGFHLPAALDGLDRWQDRAGLIETVWSRGSAVLASEYSTAVEDPTGALVLNSTAAGFNCRVVVSQLNLGRPVVDGERDCTALTGRPAASLDLHAVYGSCLPPMQWATAAMLSARFPTVTPSGRIPRPKGCENKPDLQLVDGGYAESSGIGTLAEIAPRLAAIVRDHNTKALQGTPASTSTGSAGPVVVPVMMYLEDETRADLEAPEPALSPELFVPLVARGAKDRQVTSATLTQRVADAISDPCPTPAVASSSGQLPTPDHGTLCAEVVAQVRKHLPDGVVIVAPLTVPAVDVPLGWTLSADSSMRLATAMQNQLNMCDGPPPGGYKACLKNLLNLLHPPSN